MHIDCSLQEKFSSYAENVAIVMLNFEDPDPNEEACYSSNTIRNV